MQITTKLNFEQALQSDKNLLQFWLQGQNYEGAWETLRIAIVQHIEKIQLAERLALYNKVDLFAELKEMNSELQQMKIELKTFAQNKNIKLLRME